jgi:hypothetical protein
MLSGMQGARTQIFYCSIYLNEDAVKWTIKHTVLICHVIVSKTSMHYTLDCKGRVPTCIVADVDSRYGTDERGQR